jgi:hypothetical protein
MNTRHHPNIRSVDYFCIQSYIQCSTLSIAVHIYISLYVYTTTMLLLIHYAYNTQMNRCSSRSRGCTLDVTDRTADPLLDLNLVYLKMARWLFFQLEKTVAWYKPLTLSKYFYAR